MYEAPGLKGPKVVGPYTNTTVLCSAEAARVDLAVSEPKLKALSKIAETQLLSGPGFRHTARIGAARIELLTNDPHLLDFWRTNWFSADPDGKKDGRIYAVTGIPKRDPGLFSGPGAPCVVVFNTNHYGAVQTAALLLARQRIEEAGGVVLAGAAVEIHNRGAVIIVGAPGLDIVECALSLCGHERIRILSMNWVAISPDDDGPVVRCMENAFYVPGRLVRTVPALGELVDHVSTENVITEIEACTNQACLDDVVAGRMRCVFHAGFKGCVWSDTSSSMLVDAAQLNRSYERSGAAKVVGVVVLRHVAAPDWSPKSPLDLGPVSEADVRQVWLEASAGVVSNVDSAKGRSSAVLDPSELGDAEALSTVSIKLKDSLMQRVSSLPGLRVRYADCARIDAPEALLEQLASPAE